MELKLGYKQTEIGLIPDDWDAKAIGEEIDLLIGFPFPSNGYSKLGVKLLRGSNIKRGQTDWSDDIVQYWPEVSRELARYSLQVGDLVVSMDGSLVGRSFAQLSDSDLPALLLQRVARIRSKKLDVTYLRQFVGSDQFTKYVDSVKTVTAIPHISPGDIRRFTIPVPPTIEEQRAVAQALSDVDSLLATLDQMIAKKRGLKQAAMQQLLTGKTRLPGFSGPWDVKKIGEFTDCTAGGTPSTLNSAYWDGDIPWMSSGELHLKRVQNVEGKITELGLNYSSTKIIPSHCVLIGLAGQGKTRGTVAINLIELCTNQSIAAIFPNKSFNSEYLFHNLDARYDELRELSTGDGGRGGLNLKIIKSIDIPFPSLEEQDAIALVLSNLESELSSLEARRNKTLYVKQAMMQELLTGKTRLV